MADDPIRQRVAQEIVALHGFLAGWLNGALPASEAGFAAGLEARLHPEFVNIQPARAPASRSRSVPSRCNR